MADPITGQAPAEEQATPEQREAALDADFAAVGAPTEAVATTDEASASAAASVKPAGDKAKPPEAAKDKGAAATPKTPDEIQAEIDAQVAEVSAEQNARTVAEAAERIRQEAEEKAKAEAAKAKPPAGADAFAGIDAEVMAEIAAIPAGQNPAFDAYGFNSAEGDGKNLLKAIVDVTMKTIAKAMAKSGGALPADIEQRIKGVEQHISAQQMERVHAEFMDALASDEFGSHADAREIEASPDWAAFVKEQPEHIVKALGGEGFSPDDAGAKKHLKFTGSILQLYKLKKGITGKPGAAPSKSRADQLRAERDRLDAIHRHTARGGGRAPELPGDTTRHLTEEEQEAEFARIAKENETRQPKPWK